MEEALSAFFRKCIRNFGDWYYRALNRSKLTGANVRSIALNASFLACARSEAVTTALIEEAINRGLRRQGRLVFSPAH